MKSVVEANPIVSNFLKPGGFTWSLWHFDTAIHNRHLIANVIRAENLTTSGSKHHFYLFTNGSIVVILLN